MSIITPKVFMSYSWDNSKERVKDLAERLVRDGVDVVLDIWDLEPGDDKYAYMERSVTDATITKVLMICDKSYAEKADSRSGGVGNETTVISDEVYKKVKQDKFIPVIFERNVDGEEYVPVYLKTRIYFDLSNDDDYEREYESLLRNLHSKPMHSKPPLGKMPEYLNEESVSLSHLRAYIKQLQAYDGKNPEKLNYISKKFIGDFCNTIINFTPKRDDNFDENLMKQIDASKPLRDIFIDYVEILLLVDANSGDILGDFFEQAHNKVYRIEGSSYRDSDFEFGFFAIWELFVCTTGVLLHFERYKELRTLLNRTFFLNEHPLSQNTKPYTFIEFRYTERYIDNHIKPKTETPNLYTLVGDIASKREKLPILNQRAIANADVVLYQLSEVYKANELYGWSWFPMMYVYLGGRHSTSIQEIWSKMISKRYCETLFPLFGVDSIEKLKVEIQKNKDGKREMRYGSSFDTAPTILSSISLDSIATLP